VVFSVPSHRIAMPEHFNRVDAGKGFLRNVRIRPQNCTPQRAQIRSDLVPADRHCLQMAHMFTAGGGARANCSCAGREPPTAEGLTYAPPEGSSGSGCLQYPASSSVLASWTELSTKRSGQVLGRNNRLLSSDTTWAGGWGGHADGKVMLKRSHHSWTQLRCKTKRK
jgi:hypothetical protein